MDISSTIGSESYTEIGSGTATGTESSISNLAAAEVIAHVTEETPPERETSEDTPHGNLEDNVLGDVGMSGEGEEVETSAGSDSSECGESKRYTAYLADFCTIPCFNYASRSLSVCFGFFSCLCLC